MKRPNREVEIFSLSALDLFASSMGAFIILVLIMFPYYQKKDEVQQQVETLTSFGNQFPKDFANDKCQWWLATPEKAVLSKQTFNNGYYVELYLVKENNAIILYIKYFTI